MSDFAQLLRKHREAKRWSMERLAAQANINHSLISRLESGQRTPTRASTAALVTALQLDPADAADLWFAAGFIPDLDDATMQRLRAFLRAVRQSARAA